MVELIQSFGRTQATHLAFVSAFAVVLYEYIITFDREVNYAWSRSLTWARAVFYVNSCTILPRALRIAAVVSFLVYAVFSGLRIYAISGQNRLVAGVVTVLSIVPALVFLATDALIHHKYTKFPGLLDVYLCEVIPIIMINTWNAYCVAVTVHKPQSYSFLILREGMLFFLAQFFGSIVKIAAQTNPRSLNMALWTFYMTLFPSILISRFYLNLDEVRIQGLELERRRCSVWKPLPPIPESAGPVDADDGRVEYVQAVRAYNKDEVYEKV
ncbi:hypothetical protein C8Q76DRAFT_172851 [Earliella scabrosa]|nr:hypothetical protein C8Q76DRAFT_172851 [Earliella scabrosa]